MAQHFELPPPHALFGPELRVSGLPNDNHEFWELTQPANSGLISFTPKADSGVGVNRTAKFHSSATDTSEILHYGGLQFMLASNQLSSQPVERNGSRMVLVSTRHLFPGPEDGPAIRVQVNYWAYPNNSHHYVLTYYTVPLPHGQPHQILISWYRETVEGNVVYWAHLDGNSYTMTKYRSQLGDLTQKATLIVPKGALNLQPATDGNVRRNMVMAIIIYSAVHLFRLPMP